MVTINSFIEEELNEHSRKVILDTIQEGEKSHKEKEEIVFNRFSLKYFLENFTPRRKRRYVSLGW